MGTRLCLLIIKIYKAYLFIRKFTTIQPLTFSIQYYKIGVQTHGKNAEKQNLRRSIMKKIIAILMALSLLFAFASCKDNSGEPEATTQAVTDENGETVINTDKETENEAMSANASAGGEDVSADSTAAEETTLPLTDPSTWTNDEIIEFYKNAAIKSKTVVKSQQKMTMTEMVVNDGDGLLGTVVEWATPILKSALEKNSTEFDGITGGYENLVAEDAETIKAYKSGEYVVVEMTMKEQTDGIHGDWGSGTVGHAISVVGDISVVADELPQFIIDFENADLKLHYSDPKLKVKINKDGIIEKGTWTYQVNITVAHLNIAAANLPVEVMVDSAYGTVDYITTVGGGF